MTKAIATILMLLVSGSTLVGQVERPDVRPLPAVHIHDETTWSSRWFSPDGQWIWGSSLEVQHAANGQVVDGDRINRMFRDGNDSLILRDVSSDGKLLIVEDCKSHTFRVWDIGSREIRQTLTLREAKPGTVRFPTVQFVRGDRQFAVWYEDPPTLVISDLDTSEEQRVVQLPTAGYHGLFSPSGQWFAMIVKDKGVVVWDVATAEERLVLPSGKRPTAIAFDLQERHIATGGDDNTVRIWDVAAGKRLLSLRGHGPGNILLPPAVYSLTFSPDGGLLASGGHDGRVILWDTADGDIEFEALVASKPMVMNVAFSRDATLLVVDYRDVGNERGLCIWHCLHGRPRGYMKMHRPSRGD